MLSSKNFESLYPTAREMGLPQVGTTTTTYRFGRNEGFFVDRKGAKEFFGFKTDGTGNYSPSIEDYRKMQTLCKGITVETKIAFDRRLLRDINGLFRVMNFLVQMFRQVDPSFTEADLIDSYSREGENFIFQESIQNLLQKLPQEAITLLEITLRNWDQAMIDSEKGLLGETLSVRAAFWYGIHTNPAIIAYQYPTRDIPTNIRLLQKQMNVLEGIADAYDKPWAIHTNDERGRLCELSIEGGKIARRPLLEVVLVRLKVYSPNLTIEDLENLDPSAIYKPGDERLDNLPPKIQYALGKYEEVSPKRWKKIEDSLILGLHNLHESRASEGVEIHTAADFCCDSRVQSRVGVNGKRVFAGMVLQDGIYSLMQGLVNPQIVNFDITAHTDCGAGKVIKKLQTLDPEERQKIIEDLKQKPYHPDIGEFFGQIPVIPPFITLELPNGMRVGEDRRNEVWAHLNKFKLVDLAREIADYDDVAARFIERVEEGERGEEGGLNLRVYTIDIDKTDESKDILPTNESLAFAVELKKYMEATVDENGISLWEKFLEL